MTPKTKTASASVDQRAESVTMIPIAEVHAAGDNPRRALGDLAELTESIRANGIIEPLVVVAEGHDGYKVVVGHRRRAAGELAGLPWLPCIVRTYSEMARIRTMLVENLQREDLSPLEEAAGYQLLVDQGLSQRQIAEQVGRNQSHISKHLSLLQLPEKAREAVDAGRISKEDGFELTKLAEHPEAIEQAIQRGRSYGGVGQAAVAIADQLQSEAKRKATRERLEKEGKRIIGEAQGGWQAGPNYPAARLEDVVRRASKKFDPVAHEKLGCHGYFIGWDGEAVPSCADSHKHQSPSRVRTDPEAERRMKEADQLRAKLDQLRGRREKHIQLLLAGKLGADARDHVVRQAIFIYEPEWDLAETWLGIKRPDDNTRYDEAPMAFISRWVAEAPSVRQLQAALALVLESGERILRYLHPNADDDDRAAIKGHLEFLSFSGLELAPEEASLLAGPSDVGAGEAAGAAPLSSAPSTSVDDSSNGQAAGGVLAPAHSAEVVGEPRVEFRLASPVEIDKLLESVTHKLVRVRKERQLLEQAIQVGSGRSSKTDRRQAELRALQASEATLEQEMGELQASVRRRETQAPPADDLPVGDFDEEDLPEPTPCPVCQKLACSHTIEEKASAAAAALLGAKPERPATHDPKACRECGCHGDCKGGCSWIDVDDVKGLLCSNHELVPA